jgi:hypothetical protein
VGKRERENRGIMGNKSDPGTLYAHMKKSLSIVKKKGGGG